MNPFQPTKSLSNRKAFFSNWIPCILGVKKKSTHRKYFFLRHIRSGIFHSPVSVCRAFVCFVKKVQRPPLFDSALRCCYDHLSGNIHGEVNIQRTCVCKRIDLIRSIKNDLLFSWLTKRGQRKKIANFFYLTILFNDLTENIQFVWISTNHKLQLQ